MHVKTTCENNYRKFRVLNFQIPCPNDVSYNIVTLRVDPMVVTSINLCWNHQFELATLSNINQKKHIGTHIYEQVALTIMAFNQQTILPTIPIIWACNAPTLATFIFDQKVKKKDKCNLPKACTIVPNRLFIGVLGGSIHFTMPIG
jgi:hypothetical protein